MQVGTIQLYYDCFEKLDLDLVCILMSVQLDHNQIIESEHISYLSSVNTTIGAENEL